MAILVHPQSELIREPRLLVPGMQPLGPIAAHRDAAHSVFCGYAQSASGFQLDLVTNKRPAVSGSFGSYTTTKGNRIRATNNTLSSVICRPKASTFTAGSSLTMIVSGVLAVTNNFRSLFSNGTFNIISATGICINNDRKVHCVVEGQSSRTWRAYSSALATDLLIPHIISFRFNAATQAHSVRIDKEDNTASLTIAESDNISGDAVTVPIGFGDVGTGYVFGTAEFAYVFNTWLSDGEVISIENDPYQFLIPA